LAQAHVARLKPDRMSGPEDEVRVIRTVPEIAGIRDFWTSCRCHRDALPDFFLLGLETAPQPAQPYILVLHRNGAPQALLIGRREQKQLDAGAAFLSRRMPSFATLTFVHGGSVGDIGPRESRLLIGAVIEALRRGEARIAMLDRLDVASPLHSGARTLPPFRYADHQPFRESILAVRLAGGAQSFIETLSSNERYNQRRRARRMRADFSDAVTIERFGGADEVDRLMRDAEAVAGKSYLRGLGRGFSHTPAMRRRLMLEAEKGSLFGHVLHLGERPCAFWIASLGGDRLVSDMLAYDEDYAKYAPGVYLVMEVIEALSRRLSPGERLLIDFGPGEQEYKRRLANDSWQEETLYICAPNFCGLCINAFRTSTALILNWARWLSRRSGFLRRLRHAYGSRRARAKGGEPLQ
jgi:hypothetical protein